MLRRNLKVPAEHRIQLRCDYLPLELDPELPEVPDPLVLLPEPLVPVPEPLVPEPLVPLPLVPLPEPRLEPVALPEPSPLRPLIVLILVNSSRLSLPSRSVSSWRKMESASICPLVPVPLPRLLPVPLVVEPVPEPVVLLPLPLVPLVPEPDVPLPLLEVPLPEVPELEDWAMAETDKQSEAATANNWDSVNFFIAWSIRSRFAEGVSGHWRKP